MITIETFHKVTKPVKHAALIAILSISIIMLFGCGKDDNNQGWATIGESQSGVDGTWWADETDTGGCMLPSSATYPSNYYAIAVEEKSQRNFAGPDARENHFELPKS